MGYHVPVLLHESVGGLVENPDGVYVDLTFGGGGHSQEILKRLSPKGQLLAFDQDADAMANAIDDSRFSLTRCNFKYFRHFLRFYGINEVDGILADLGVSSHHFDSPHRGFSFRFRGALDMRMNQDSALSAAHVVNDYNEAELCRVLKDYGELPNAKRLTGMIVKTRQQQRIETVEGLTDAINDAFPAKARSKMLAKVFQAIRIEVNGEMDALRTMLTESLRALKSGGVIAVISYHSLEDRLVKNYLRTGNFEGKQEQDFFGKVVSPFEVITRKVKVPSSKEVDLNSRARSAKLRIGRKL